MHRRFFQITGSLGFVLVLALVLKMSFATGGEKVTELNVAKKADSVTKERRFVIVVASYNNENYYERNLDSLFSQEYGNYHVIYTDDASTDQTYALVKDYVEKRGVQDKITLIHNEKNQKTMHNIFKAIHSCNDDDIVLIVDGDDRLTHPYVLRDLNYYYENQDVWMTYGQYIRYPDGELGMCIPVAKSKLREGKLRLGEWKYAHLRTFYAGLFKRIKLEDLMHDGKFFQVTCDLAIMYPMLEMARDHAYFTPDVSYEYNYASPLNDVKVREVEQEKMAEYIRHMPIYDPLLVHPTTSVVKEESACDLVLFTYNRPMQAYAFLESLYEKVSGFRKVLVIARIDPEYQEGYRIVKETFPEVVFFEQSANPKADFKPLVLDLVFGNVGKGADYIIFGVDDILLTDTIDLKKDMKKLQETNAYGVYYRLGDHVNFCYMMNMYQGVPHLMDVGDDLYTWRFKDSKGDWDYPNSQDLVLLKKEDIRSDVEKIKFTFPNDFEARWAQLANHEKFGLCHKRSKMVNIPMNVVSDFQNINANTFTVEELNNLFMQGLKMDVTQFYLIENSSVHADLIPYFIPRETIQLVNTR